MGDNKTRENHKSPTEDRTLEFSFPRLVVIFVLLSSRPRNLLIGSLVSFANVRRTSGKRLGQRNDAPMVQKVGREKVPLYQSASPIQPLGTTGFLSSLLQLKDIKRLMVYERKRKG